MKVNGLDFFFFHARAHCSWLARNGNSIFPKLFLIVHDERYKKVLKRNEKEQEKNSFEKQEVG